MSNAISLENLGKSYWVGHNHTIVDRHQTFRDMLTREARGLARKTRDMLGGRAIIQGDQVEEFWALKHVSFEVRQGDRLGIIGRNGAGKSTLLKLLSRITEPTEGCIRLNGRVSSLLEVGTGFHGELSGRENIFLNGAILGMNRKEIRHKFDEIVDFAGVEKFLDTPVKRYSSGMYVRLAFAVAAHLEPEILVVDEVLAVGDAEFQKKCLGKMKEVGDAGRTVIFVSHQMDAVRQMCTHAMILEQGTVEHYGDDVSSCISRYLNATMSANLGRWENSGTEFDHPAFRPKSLWLGNEDGEDLSMPATNDQDFWIHFIGEATEPDPALAIGYNLFNERGDMIYTSSSVDEEIEKWPSLMASRIHIKTKIPKFFLNEGRYVIRMFAYLHGQYSIIRNVGFDNVPSVALHIQGGLSLSPYWMGSRPGIVAPVMEWVRQE